MTRHVAMLPSLLPLRKTRNDGLGWERWTRIHIAHGKQNRSSIEPDLLRVWWALRDSNPEPRDYESPALTVAPRAREIGHKHACNPLARKKASGFPEALNLMVETRGIEPLTS